MYRRKGFLSPQLLIYHLLQSPAFLLNKAKECSHTYMFLSKSVGCTEACHRCQNHRSFFRQGVSYNMLLCLRKSVSSSANQSQSVPEKLACDAILLQWSYTWGDLAHQIWFAGLLFAQSNAL